MSTIIVGFDGTEGACSALTEATRLATDLGAAVHLVFSYSTGRLGGELRDLDAAVADRAKQVLAEGTALAAEQGTTVTTEFRREDPAEGLIAAADELDARYVVVGSYGERPLKSALVGSTPTRLLHLCERPVLVVRAPEGTTRPG
jgi:nucleotide-binding universal stress UspA family protein